MSKPQSLTDSVLSAVRSLYPEALADSAWDNTGLLIGEAPSFTSATSSVAQGTVLLTNDLTAAVVDEALNEDAKVIICYHPVIFRPLKSITASDPMQAQLLRLIAAGVSVYCPHTAVDAASGGLNDWLCDLLLDGENAASKTVVEPIKGTLPEGHEGCGYGRTVEFSSAVSFPDLLKRFSKGIGGHRYMMVALPSSYKKDISAIPPISKAAVCAGSGSSVLSSTDAQVLVTGEMSHHDALRHSSLGQIVVTVFHSNSERQYLTQRMKPMLEEALKDSPHANTRIVVSTADSDPFDVIDVESL
ncbi:GTP cyclohydrolase 1 type 2/Nif3 [Microdochium bolleyi]|uniref:GTP cyclohydrolase 1 type 2/Nif3 n=1 Tax=Microdochium bolleyi TaxID=196109 RepID=A0A136IYR7_9PEZI|nr:GTP cyclohydrolase 1 type 2/Nif3 [Microdochium bolleyi]